MRAAAIILFVLSALAADIGVISDERGLAIAVCHPDDRAIVEVRPLNTNRYGGIFVTTNRLITIRDAVMTMIPAGTNLARVRTICSGQTSEVREVTFVVRRPVAKPRVGFSLSATAHPIPPMPPGLNASLPLPQLPHRSQ